MEKGNQEKKKRTDATLRDREEGPVRLGEDGAHVGRDFLKRCGHGGHRVVQQLEDLLLADQVGAIKRDLLIPGTALVPQ